MLILTKEQHDNFLKNLDIAIELAKSYAQHRDRYMLQQKLIYQLFEPSHKRIKLINHKELFVSIFNLISDLESIATANLAAWQQNGGVNKLLAISDDNLAATKELENCRIALLSMSEKMLSCSSYKAGQRLQKDPLYRLEFVKKQVLNAFIVEPAQLMTNNMQHQKLEPAANTGGTRIAPC